MANISQLITSTERDENFEKARVQRLRAMASEKYQEFENEVLGIAGKVNGLGSSRFAVGEQKNYKVTPGGPKNLDLDENSLCRYKPSPSSKMNISPSVNDLASQTFKLGGLKNSRQSLEISPSDGGGVSLVSSTPAVVKDSTAKKPNHQKLFEQMVLKDHENRMNSSQRVTPTEVDSSDGATMPAVLVSSCFNL